jgi:CBS domain-containing protein
VLQYRFSYKEATAIAVRLGHIFALLFAYIGLVHGHIFLLLIAAFIYMAASSEGMQVEVQEILKRYVVRDVLARNFIHIGPDARLSKVLELMFHTHQEDYPVMDESGHMVGFVTRREVMFGMHERGKEAVVSDVMRTGVPMVDVMTRLDRVQKLMQKNNLHALPVRRKGEIIGVVTLDDINRIYVMMSER